MIRVCIIIRTLRGVCALSAEIVKFERASENVTPKPIIRLFISKFVTASEEQIPSICFQTEFSLKAALMKISFLFIGLYLVIIEQSQFV